MLCVGDGCYVSSGLGTPAVHMPRWQTLGPGNTLGRRAGPCNRQLTCTYRGVELAGTGAWIQPISMGFWRHDRRDIRSVRPDQTCKVFNRRLYCAKPVIAHGYRAWIVPEAIAEQAGPDAMLQALEDGLPTARVVEREAWWAKVHDAPTR